MLAAIIIVSVLVGLYLLCLVINLFAFHPPRYKKNKYQGDLHENHLDVAEYKPYKSGLHKHRGYLYKADNPKGLVFFCHGIGSSSDYYIPEVLRLRELGYNVYTFEYRGYWMNKGFFKGINQALVDLRNAIEQIDDHTLPVTLMGHSMGGYTVQTVSKILKHKHNIVNIISISGFSMQIDVLFELFDKFKAPKFLRYVILGILATGQFTYFGRSWDLRAQDVINENTGINTMVIQSIDDNDVKCYGSSIYNQKEKINHPSINYKLFEEKPFNTHMGVIRGAGKGMVNEELFAFINEHIK